MSGRSGSGFCAKGDHSSLQAVCHRWARGFLRPAQPQTPLTRCAIPTYRKLKPWQAMRRCPGLTVSCGSAHPKCMLIKSHSRRPGKREAGCSATSGFCALKDFSCICRTRMTPSLLLGASCSCPTLSGSKTPTLVTVLPRGRNCMLSSWCQWTLSLITLRVILWFSQRRLRLRKRIGWNDSQLSWHLHRTWTTTGKTSTRMPWKQSSQPRRFLDPARHDVATSFDAALAVHVGKVSSICASAYTLYAYFRVVVCALRT
mmetsp:Transcript_49018/g.121675  ORF Transcript_49018/g.121675 Transcript_49018/m.121675 type:complete len:258 (+) Transcript_49018:458-1231(+)